MADPTRVRLLLALRHAPRYPAELAGLLCVTRQNLSNHLAVLRSSGLVIGTAESRRTCYRLAAPDTVDALETLLGLLLDLEADPSTRPSPRPAW